MKMKSLFSLLLAAWFVGAPAVVHACPMCFQSGGNDGAFLYGSILLMVVPVLSLGGLGYWAYRRIKAIDDGTLTASELEANPPENPRNASGNGVVLPIASRR
jgi:hypothetical protein